MRRALYGLWLAVALAAQVCAAQQSLCTAQDAATQPTLAVRSVKVEGGEQLNETAVAATKPAFRQTTYRGCELKDALAEAAERVRMVFQEHGYFTAKVEDARTIPAAGGNVDVVFAVTPGLVYRLGEIRFTHARAFGAEQLRAAFALEPGEIFNLATFSRGLERLRELHVAKGYVNFAAVPTPESDENARTVSWTIDIDEGAIYKLGALILDGPEPGRGVGKTLLLDWQRCMGQVYDPAILRQFLREHAALLRVRNPDLHNMLDTLIDTQEHIVTVRLNFPE